MIIRGRGGRVVGHAGHAGLVLGNSSLPHEEHSFDWLRRVWGVGEWHVHAMWNHFLGREGGGTNWWGETESFVYGILAWRRAREASSVRHSARREEAMRGLLEIWAAAWWRIWERSEVGEGSIWVSWRIAVQVSEMEFEYSCSPHLAHFPLGGTILRRAWGAEQRIPLHRVGVKARWVWILGRALDWADLAQKARTW